MKKWAMLWLMVLGLAVWLPWKEESIVSAGGNGVMILPDNVPVVALTFDDGPKASTTTRLLEGLALREVPATFFLVGSRVAEEEDLVRQMAEAGHQIGVHTYDHVMLTELTPQIYAEQVERTRNQLIELLGEGEYWLRPPYGLMDETLSQWEPGPLILWSVDPEDWDDRNTARIVREVLAEVEDGSILLLHDIYEESVDAALQIVDELLNRGYCFLTVRELMELRHVTYEPGKRYMKFPVE